MKNYFIISKKSVHQLALEVNEHLDNGNECLGSPFQDAEKNFNQAMLSKVLVNKKGKVIEPAPKSAEVDVKIEDGKKTLVPKTTYKQNSEQEVSGNWSKIKDLPEQQPVPDTVVKVDYVLSDQKDKSKKAHPL